MSALTSRMYTDCVVHVLTIGSKQVFCSQKILANGCMINLFGVFFIWFPMYMFQVKEI